MAQPEVQRFDAVPDTIVRGGAHVVITAVVTDPDSGEVRFHLEVEQGGEIQQALDLQVPILDQEITLRLTAPDDPDVQIIPQTTKGVWHTSAPIAP